MTSLELLWTIKAQGSGLMTCLCFWQNSLLCPSDDGKVSIWTRKTKNGEEIGKGENNRTAKKEGGEGEGEEEEEEIVSEVYETQYGGPMFYLGWSDAKRTSCWLGSVGAIHLLHLHREETERGNAKKGEGESKKASSHLVQYHEITCCGIDVDSTGDYVAAGDFGTNVIIWNVKLGTIIARCSVAHPVRSLAWRRQAEETETESEKLLEGGERSGNGRGRGRNFLLIGCTDGTIHYWEPIITGLAPTLEFAVPYLSFEGTITSLRWEQSRYGAMLSIFLLI
jgi:WD40 repeat protein